MILIKGAKIYPVEGPVLNPGMMLINRDGKIVEIDNVIEPPAETTVLDFSGKVILPGLIDIHTHIGIWGDGEGKPGYDGNELPQPVNARIRTLDAVNPFQQSFASAREGGITTVQILPGSNNPIGGLGFACKTAGKIIDEMVIKNPTGLKGALGENPKRIHGRNLKHAPSTRMGTAALIREYFLKSREYLKKKKTTPANEFHIDLNLEAGAMVLERKIPFRVHAHRHDDIVTAIRICEDFDIDFSIEHCTDGHLIAEFLGEKNVVANIGPGLAASSKPESSNFTDKNPAILARHGVKISLMTDHPYLNCRYFLAYGAVAHKYGLSFHDTLRAMTLNPAEVMGIEDRVGSLVPGKDADFIVLNNEPFSYTTVVEKTFIEGREVWSFSQI